MNSSGILILFFVISFLAGSMVMLFRNKALTKAVTILFAAVHV
jgi:hypothetical protein